MFVSQKSQVHPRNLTQPAREESHNSTASATSGAHWMWHHNPLFLLSVTPNWNVFHLEILAEISCQDCNSLVISLRFLIIYSLCHSSYHDYANLWITLNGKEVKKWSNHFESPANILNRLPGLIRFFLWKPTQSRILILMPRSGLVRSGSTVQINDWLPVEQHFLPGSFRSLIRRS